MKNQLDFKVPFINSLNTTFTHCFASAYMYLKKIGSRELNVCHKWEEDNVCDFCHNCANREGQEYITLFETMCGRNALRCRYDGELTEMQKLIEGTEADGRSCGTDYTTDFLFGFTGYEYRKYTDKSAFKNEIIASIDMDRPVIAEFASGKKRFRVIIGYDRDTLITGNAYRENSLPYDDLKTLYIFREEIAPRYTVKDGFKNIQNVMEYNFKEKIWNDYIKNLSGGSYELGLYYGFEPVDDYSDASWLDCVEAKERKVRMNRLAEAAIYAWNSFFTNVGIGVAKRIYEEMRNPAIIELLGNDRNFDVPNYCIMDFGHMINRLNAKPDLMDGKLWDSGVQGYGVMIAMAIECTKIMENKVLETIKKAVAVL